MVDLALRTCYLYIYLSIPFEKFGLLHRYICSSNNSTIVYVMFWWYFCDVVG